MQGSDHPSGRSHIFPAFSRLVPPISADFRRFLVKCKAPMIPQGIFSTFPPISADFRRFLVKCKALMIPQGIPATFSPISADFSVKRKAPMIPQGVPTPFSAGFRRFPPISADFGP